MIRLCSLAEAAGFTRAQGSVPAAEYSGVSTDTRSLQAGDLFVALRGEHFDGHRFLAQAREAGAVAAIVDQPDHSVDLPQLTVADTLVALGQLAAANRDESTARIVAVTGSSGKTTVKEMVAAIMAEVAPTLATKGNLNNHIGVPLTLLRIASEHRFAVVEHGASGVGEIAQTVALTRPDVGIITNAAEAHLEGFGSYDNIVIAKGELIDGVVAGGVVVLNQDDPAWSVWNKRASARKVVSVSARPEADASYKLVSLERLASTQVFEVAGPEGWRCRVSLALPGEHNVVNALLAIAACHELGVAQAYIEQGLDGMTPVAGRLNPLPIRQDLTLIDDSYNANPASMKAALKVLAGLPGTRIAMLGAMAELGGNSAQLHQDVGAAAYALGIEQLVTVGPGCEGYRAGFGEHAVACEDHAAAVAYLLTNTSGPTTVLIKGSRSSAMDIVARDLKEKVDNSCCSG